MAEIMGTVTSILLDKEIVPKILVLKYILESCKRALAAVCIGIQFN